MSSLPSSSSSPSSSPIREYRQAERSRDTFDQDDYVLIQGRPYYPNLWVVGKHDDDGYFSSIGNVVEKILFGGTNNKDSDECRRQWTYERIAGGITNRLIRVSGLLSLSAIVGPDNLHCSNHRLSVGDACLVRLFGGEGMIDRHVESAIFCLLADTPVTSPSSSNGAGAEALSSPSSSCLAPPYYGRFANGRIEGWMTGMRPLLVEELRLPHVLQAMPLAVAQLHSHTELQAQISQLLNESSHVEENNDNDAAEPPGLWKQMDAWMEQAMSYEHFQTSHDTQRARALLYHHGEDMTVSHQQPPENVTNTAPTASSTPTSNGNQSHLLSQQLEWLKREVVPKDAVTVFCHNDLLAANILYRDDDHNDNNDKHGERDCLTTNHISSKIQLIDFEYGGMNYAAFDLANHFNEFAGGTDTSVPNYEWLPTKEQQYQFLQVYIMESQRCQDRHPESGSKGLDAPDGATDLLSQVDKLYHDVQAFMLINHMYWALWAINQAAMEGCRTFDYLNYATNRMKQYRIDQQARRWIPTEAATTNTTTDLGLTGK